MQDHQGEHQEELDTLRFHRGSHVSRLLLRKRLRDGTHHVQKPAPDRTTNGKQVPYYAPPSDRASLSTISESTLKLDRKDEYDKKDDLVTKNVRMHVSTTTTSHTSRLLDLPLELRQQIYSYLFPWNEQHMFQTSTHGKIPNFSIECATEVGDLSNDRHPYEEPQAHPAIMRVNRQLYHEARDYIFHGCIIQIRVDESGFSFLESRFGGDFPDAKAGRNGVESYSASDRRLNYQCKDRFTDWHKSFTSKFDFTQPKKLVIQTEAPDYENPEGVLQIRESMMSLCDVLRKFTKIKAVEVEPRSQKYRHTEQEYREAGKNDTHGSYFMWEWESHILPTSKPWFEHKLKSDQYRRRFNKEAVWRGKLSHLLWEKTPDLQLVLEPLYSLQNVGEATIILPPTTHDITSLQAGIQRACRNMKGVEPGIGPSNALKLREFFQKFTKECQQALKAPKIRKRIKKAGRTKVKDQWYQWHCETCEEWTESGEPGYDSDDDSDW